MKRIDIDKNIRAKTIEKAAEKFDKFLTEKGYEWVNTLESVENGYYCCSNAVEHEIHQYGEPTSPKTNDWTFYWAIQHIDGNEWYAWFIEIER